MDEIWRFPSKSEDWEVWPKTGSLSFKLGRLGSNVCYMYSMYVFLRLQYYNAASVLFAFRFALFIQLIYN